MCTKEVKILETQLLVLDLWGIQTVQYVYAISSVILWDITNNKVQINSTSGMPLQGQPSFCLKVTSSLVLFLFTTQDDLTVKRPVCTQLCFSYALYTAVFLSSMLSCLSLLSFLYSTYQISSSHKGRSHCETSLCPTLPTF